MVPHYLYPSGRFAELMMSLFTTCLGLWLHGALAQGGSALAGFNLDAAAQSTFSALLIAAGVFHAAGVHVNGRWWASPLVRAVAMTFAAGLCVGLIFMVDRFWSAYTLIFGFLWGWYIVAAGNAWRDSVIALTLRSRGRHG